MIRVKVQNKLYIIHPLAMIMIVGRIISGAHCLPLCLYHIQSYLYSLQEFLIFAPGESSKEQFVKLVPHRCQQLGQVNRLEAINKQNLPTRP